MTTDLAIKEKLCALSLLKCLDENPLSLEEVRKSPRRILSVYSIKQIVYILETFTNYGIVFFEPEGQDRIYYLTSLGKRLVQKVALNSFRND
ncbi:hypothetical protein [Listeria booriae]|uniref:hypothetical protein n=1 Tax=Listeria booriae TaxID=1552123 RepID=UPI001626A072|nr:hypothetical protein [Listeria booriae]MBC2321813.1 hypothetical protein [Listeria booriae]MCD2205696.1 hypothetical protein [Listeria booriae]